MSRAEIIKAVHELIENKDTENAMPLIYGMLEDDPNDPAALFSLGYIYIEADKNPFAYMCFKRASVSEPKRPAIWNNLGRACMEMDRYDEALTYFLKAVELDPNYALGYTSVASCLLSMGRYDEAIRYDQESLEIEPENKKALIDLGFCYLAKQDWKRGWECYEESLNGRFRKEWVYGDESRWDGSKDKTIVVYGEQGLGDEIMYASVVPDAIRDSKQVIIDCDRRLEGLLKRSFPKAHVYGTRLDEHPHWLGDYEIDARCGFGSLPKFYRNRYADFPGNPYLVADPLRRVQWRALFYALSDKPKIGITWGGGTKRTYAKGRAIPLDAFETLFNGIDAEWISLSHKDPGDLSNYPIHHFSRATETKDYDDTAALIAELDLVIGVHTTATHCAGALGVPTITLVPHMTHWIYAKDSIPWYSSMRLFRQKGKEDWSQTIKRLHDSDFCGLRSTGARGVSHLLRVSDKAGE